MSRGLGARDPVPQPPLSAVLASIAAVPADGAARRDSILALEAQAVDRALALAQGDAGTLDPLLEKIAVAVAATGIETDPRKALHRVISRVDGEHWSAAEQTRFGLVDSLKRSQGLAIDSAGSVYFSGNFSLSRLSPSLSLEVEKKAAIPQSLKDLGINHIGDIDVAGGQLYAPMEDGSSYQHPHVVVFDAATLVPIKTLRFPVSLQPDGMPYIAVDAKAGRMYSSEYGDPKQLNVYALDEMATPLEPITLSEPLHHVQGAVTKNGMLFVTCDDAEKRVLKINLRTGTVMPVASLGSGGRELEGIAFAPGDEEKSLRVTSVEGNNDGFFNKLKRRVTVTAFTRDRASLRDGLR